MIILRLASKVKRNFLEKNGDKFIKFSGRTADTEVFR